MHTFIILLSLLIGVPGAQAFFSDVPTDHPHFDAINALQDEGIIEGIGQNHFSPDTAITRAEFAKILLEGFVSDESINDCIRPVPFPDVKQGDWFAQYVCLAWERGIVKGYPDGTFRPHDNINTAEASVVLARTFVGAQEEGDVWYHASLVTLADRHALPGTLHHLAEPLRRGQMAEMVNRLKNGDTNKETFFASGLEERSRIVTPTGYAFDEMTEISDKPVGAQVGGMTLSKIDGWHVVFTGDIVVTARYSVPRSGFDGMGYDGPCLSDFDADSLNLLPSTGWPGFCLTSNSLTDTIAPGSTGKITVRIAELTRVHCGCEAWSTAVVTSIVKIEPDPTDEASCREVGGDWQGNAQNPHTRENSGHCYPANNPYASKMPAFDGCGSFPSYSEESWYADVKTALAKNAMTASDIGDTCVALNGSLVVMLAPFGNGKSSEIWRYETETGTLEKAARRASPNELHLEEFKKREGHILPVVSMKDIPGFCLSEVRASYNFVNNDIEADTSQCIESYNR